MPEEEMRVLFQRGFPRSNRQPPYVEVADRTKPSCCGSNDGTQVPRICYRTLFTVSLFSIKIRPYQAWSNFWGSLTTDGFYARSIDYMEIVQGQRRWVKFAFDIKVFLNKLFIGSHISACIYCDRLHNYGNKRHSNMARVACLVEKRRM